MQSMGNPTVNLSSWHFKYHQALPIQGCHGTHVFNTYVPGTKVPLWFSINNLGSSVYFIVPSNLNSRVRGLSICSVYKLSCAPPVYYWKVDTHIVVSNRTKGLIWSYVPEAFGVGEAGEDMMWLSYWKFGIHLFEAGDELNVLVFGGEFVQVKVVGVRLLCNEEQEEMSSQSDYEENVSHQIHPFGNIIRGNVSAHKSSTILYQLGKHLRYCDYCRRLFPQAWIPAFPFHDDRKFECWASTLLMPKSYYLSDSCLVEDLGC